MTWWQSLAQFASGNSASIIVSVVVGLLFFVLGPIGLWFSGRRIRKERIRKAKEAIVDLLESMLVSQEDVTPGKLKALFSAVEREIEVNLDGVYDIQLLVEDLMLRFERSRHLDSQQKQQYFKRLADVQAAIHAKPAPVLERPLQRRTREIIDELRNKTHAQEGCKELIDELQAQFERRPELTDPFIGPLLLVRRLIQKDPKKLAIIFVITMFVYVAIVFLFVTLTR